MLVFDRQGRFSPLRALVLLGCCAPAIALVAGFAADSLGAKPLETLIHETGLWSLRLLVATLVITPFRLITGVNRLFFMRRMLGVSAFAYALAHLVLYIADQKFDLVKVVEEVVVRFYLSIGFVALAAMAALAATSFDAAIRRLGAARWSRLHTLVYPLTLLALWHSALQAKLKVFEPLVLAGLFGALMVVRWMRGRLTMTPLALGGLVLFALLFTAAIEYGWYAAVTNIPAHRVLEANFALALAPRPALVTAMILLALPLAAVAKRIRRP